MLFTRRSPPSAKTNSSHFAASFRRVLSPFWSFRSFAVRLFRSSFVAAPGGDSTAARLAFLVLPNGHVDFNFAVQLPIQFELDKGKNRS
jgi:hypothetical protein